MADLEPVAPAPDPAPAEPARPRFDELVDRWFGDLGIPNHFRAAVEELKKRLAAAD